uniref:Uncharacterized protein n=1 Tax=Physcomitrium patens TaxID=3218 RepID=A0A2K1L2A1_PHYPA|nr:hypothetical protein PHYPA_002947 [Physcomitrium patens]
MMRSSCLIFLFSFPEKVYYVTGTDNKSRSSHFRLKNLLFKWLSLRIWSRTGRLHLIFGFLILLLLNFLLYPF